jgi:PAS domain S-box-containing protein
MPGTISCEKQVSAACAVFKIDLKGRFVYIDDETEELFGLTREELFGKSIYDFISNDSHQVLDTILGQHKRYESFFESFPLTIREGDGRFSRLDAVITLNFISGNPVNYQFILLSAKADELAPGINWERRLLKFIQCRPGKIDFNAVAEMFCSLGGYTAAECFLSGTGRSLEIAGSHPHQDPGHSAPSYLETFRSPVQNRFSFIPEDNMLQEGFGNGKSEAVLSLRFYNERDLLVWLYGPPEYRPPESGLENIRLFTDAWNTHFKSLEEASSPGSQFTVLGQTADALKLGLLVVGGDFNIVLKNTYFDKGVQRSVDSGSGDNFTTLYQQLEISDLQTQPIPFDESIFSRSVSENQFLVECLKIDGQEHPLTIMAGPVTTADTTFFVFCFIPFQDAAAEANAMNRSGTKLVLSVAHDIRAPLITIEAFAKRLQANHADQLDDDGRFAVDCVVENGNILQQMIDGLGEMSQNRIAREKPKKLYAKKIIEDLVNYLKATYPGVRYHVKIPEGLPEIYAPKRKLVQLFRNILDNAFKYSAASNNPNIKIEYGLVDGWHQFSITDNGPGVEEEYRQKIFAPFFRTPEVVSLPGTGMGLAIASDIIASWGGKIWLDASHQDGTRILFVLPPHMKG